MIEFSIDTPNRPGQLAQLARELANARINIHTLSAVTVKDAKYIRIVVDDDEAARKVLADAGIVYGERRIVTACLRDKPGALADLADALTATGTNIEAFYLISSDGEEMNFALAVDDPDYTGDQ